ncbi:hypothetical protein P168DRAFT_267315 [Aspergillus campestris IBT 28561]|uniref:Zn(II)2Cys6 transcription factor n=1 Tax=Aspergillus campestris (strain IBT 28561) TaxID=1392248 RepID=A0A2I1D4A0_ASPC2|nr:uncharacterized protein P168DRAFT_267315 [Aspergillus campestris IBT 28561]PKY04704.1 hypothetical protein P168DRAFT_267315 [Aspergillus campestris IBT 28561]
MPIQPSRRLSQYGCLECDERHVKRYSLPRSAKFRYMTSTIMINSPSTPSATSPSNYSDAIDLAGTPNTQDLELTLQWCTATYRSIATSTSVEKTWQAVIPQEAIAHPFLTHGLMALSALHVASTGDDHSKEEYITTAQSHYNKAVCGFEKAVKTLNKSTCDAVFAMCHIDLVYSFALPLTMQSSNNNPIDNLCHILTHIQTSSPTITATNNSITKDNPLNPLSPRPPSSHDARMPNTSQLAITALTRLNNTLSTQDPSHPASTYTTTITHLASSLETLLHSSNNEETPLSTMQWTYHVPAAFLALVRSRRPFALVLLAHYAVILHAMRASWWVGEWGERIIRECGLALGGEWRGACGWVVDATGVFVNLP